jgi:hypothetical protein
MWRRSPCWSLGELHRQATPTDAATSTAAAAIGAAIGATATAAAAAAAAASGTAAAAATAAGWKQPGADRIDLFFAWIIPRQEKSVGSGVITCYKL